MWLVGLLSGFNGSSNRCGIDCQIASVCEE